MKGTNEDHDLFILFPNLFEAIYYYILFMVKEYSSHVADISNKTWKLECPAFLQETRRWSVLLSTSCATDKPVFYAQG